MLKAAPRKMPIEVFLCGPGLAAANHDVRELARSALATVPNVHVTYGEHIEQHPRFKRRGTDMQTLESQFSHYCDLTVLILDSPGSFAEIGTFTMMQSLRTRLIALVPDLHYGSSSYISRGPLSIIAQARPANVIYFNKDHIDAFSDRLRHSIVFYKYIAHTLGHLYYSEIRINQFSRSYPSSGYLRLVSDHWDAFMCASALVAILCLRSPTFPDLLLATGMSPRELMAALRALFATASISKDVAGRYTAVTGYSDANLKAFSSTALSTLRAKLAAAN